MTSWNAMTFEEDAKIRRLAIEGLHPAAIGRVVGRHRASIYRQLRKPPMTEDKKPRDFVNCLGAGITIPDEVLSDRDRRMDLSPRDLSAALCGDPLPGYSALDRRA